MLNWMFEGRRAWCAALLFVVIALVPGVATGQEAEDPASTAGVPVVEDLDARLTTPPEDVVLPDIPADISADPQEALITAVNEQSEFLGYGLDKVDHRSAIENANLSDEFAGRLAVLMQAVIACPIPFPHDRQTPSGTTTEAQIACAAEASDAAAGVSQAMNKNSSASGDVQAQGGAEDMDAWPALYIDEDKSDDKYIYDYSVLIDKGGDDVYDNNAGGNLLDNFHGPEGSVAPSNKPAIGCEHPHVVPQFPGTVAPPFDCIADRQTVLMDKKGNDQYGVFKKPRQRDTSPLPEGFTRKFDGQCTKDKVIRRIMLQGAGLQGNAMLKDEAGSDKYYGKTASQGTGHDNGVGMLQDFGKTRDEYLAIRSSQGFSLVGGVGLLQDDGGDDWYHTYMPRPKDMDAPFGEAGYGGVVDDSDQCDRLPRQTQGAGISFGQPGGQARLIDEDGNDRYEASPPQDQLFLPPDNPASVFRLRHSSQGFGCDQTIGMLDDRGNDVDVYRGGPRNRKNGTSVTDLQVDCGTFPPGVGIFKDDGPKKQSR